MRGAYLLSAIVVTAAVSAAELAERPNFTGNWVSGDTKMVIRQDPSSIEISQQGGSDANTALTLKCNTSGKECGMSDRGHKASVRVW